MGDGSGGDRFLDRGGSRNLQHDLSLQQWGCAQLYRMRNGAGNAPLQKFSVFIFYQRHVMDFETCEKNISNL